MQRGSFLVSEVVRYSPLFAHLPEVGKGSGNPAPKLADRWKSGVWLGKSDLTDEHRVRTDDGVVYARSVRRLTENSWSEENLKAIIETTEAKENVFVKRRLMAKSTKRPTTSVPPPEDPVKRRLLKKTDMRNDEVVMNVDQHLVNVVNMLTKDENMPEANSNEDNEMPKLTVLVDYEEMMKGKQKELNSLKEMGTMTVVKRPKAVGKRTIQTRWADREKDGRVKSRLVLKDYNRCQRRTQPEMFSPTPSTLSLKTMLAASSHDRKKDPESNHITVSIDVHTAFLHADVDQDLFAETARTR